MVTLGYHIDSLDICFGTQLADSRGDIGNLCIGVGTRFLLDSLVETLGHSLKFFVLVE